jgi:prepilin-type processing-associated H-X9-DG protein
MNSGKPKLIMKLPQRKSVRALTRVEVLVVVVSLAILAFLLLQVPVENKSRRQRIVCANNLQQIGLAFRYWEGESPLYPMQFSATNGGAMEPAMNGIAFPAFQVMSNELKNPKILVCPADTPERLPAKDFTTDFSNSKISYFIGLDADEDTMPAMLLSGDRNITNGTPLRNGILELTTNHVGGWTHEIHNSKGNILLTDGSVQQVTSEKLNFLLQNSGVATNRLLMP